MASLTQNFNRAMAEWAQKEGERLTLLARTVAPRSPAGFGNDRPGRGGVRFADSLAMRVRPGGGGSYAIEIHSGTEFPQAVWVRSNYVINARNAPDLIFRTYDGAWHQRKSVFHRANPWAEELLAREEPRIVASLAAACDTFLQSLGKRK